MKKTHLRFDKDNYEERTNDVQKLNRSKKKACFSGKLTNSISKTKGL